MKKIFTLLVGMFIGMQSVCFGEISYSVDKFDGHVQIKSAISRATGRFTEVFAYRDFMNGSDIGGSFSLMMMKRDWYFFAVDRPIDIKFDDSDVVYQLRQGSSSSKIISTYSLLTVTTSTFEDTMLDRFLCAKKVTLRAYFNNQPPVTWDMSERIIKEWKRVFVTGKDGKVPTEYMVVNPDTEQPIVLKDGIDY